MVRDSRPTRPKRDLIVRRGWAVPVIGVWCFILFNSPIFWGSMVVITGGLYCTYVDHVMTREAERSLHRRKG